MARFELNVYGENDEVIKTLATDILRFGVMEDAVNMAETLDEEKPQKQVENVKEIMKQIFKGCTDEDLRDVDIKQMFDTFRQVVSSANPTNGMENQKNG